MRRWRVAFLFLLVVYQFFLSPFFSHIHVVDGQRVVHQHPYAAHHNHTSQGFVAVDLVNHNTGIAAEMLAIPAFFLDHCETIQTQCLLADETGLQAIPSLRAPPVGKPCLG